MMNPLKEYVTTKLVRQSELFDAAWYLRQYEDVAESTIDPVRHFVIFGARELRNPSPVFDTNFYLRQFPDLDPAKINPLCHYLLVGEGKGAWPNPYFDPLLVRGRLPSETQKRKSSLSAYLSMGTTVVPPSDRFAPESYLRNHQQVSESETNPLLHYLSEMHIQDQTPFPIQGPIHVSNFSGLTPIATKDNCIRFRVLNDDPYLEFQYRDGSSFSPGHYRLELSLDASLQTLASAKCYFDRGTGFSESDAELLRFRMMPDSRMVAEISLNSPVKRLRFDPVDSIPSDSMILGFGTMSLKPISRSAYYASLINEISSSEKQRAQLLLDSLATAALRGPKRAAENLRRKRNAHFGQLSQVESSKAEYKDWVEAFDTITAEDQRAMKRMLSDLREKPLISVVMPVYNTPEDLLRECIDSVIDQVYPRWEFCIADDNSSAAHIRPVLEEYAQKDPRIKVVFRGENGHISKATNSAIEVSTGEWLALLDHDDLLPCHALFSVAAAINDNPEALILYSDEDKIDLEGNRTAPYFKSDWNERLVYEQNMISHLGVYNAELIQRIGGFRAGLEGAQDYDLLLRASEHVKASQIVHIPEILYHWRMLPGSTALATNEKSYAQIAGSKALHDAANRRGLSADIAADPDTGYYRLAFRPPENPPLVTIVIPTRDGLDILEPCITSILEKTRYENFEILIIDNQSEREETLTYFAELKKNSRIRVLLYDDIFNYSAINNFAVSNANGDLVCLLNNDTEVISENWLDEMVAELSQAGVGAVGAKLLYTDGTIQHAGVVLGAGGDPGVAAHSLVGLPGNDPGYFAHAALSREVSAVTAACLLTRKDVFEEVGGLNEADLKVAFNDVDFCMKIRKSGYKIIWTPHAALYHHESKSRGLEDTPEKKARFEKEVRYMIDKWGDTLLVDPYYNPNLTLNGDTYTIAKKPRASKAWSKYLELQDHFSE